MNEVDLSLFVAGAAFGEVYVSLFVAGAAFGERWNDSRREKCCNFQSNMFPMSGKSSPRGVAGCGLRFYGRSMLGSVSGLWTDRSHIGYDTSTVFREFF